MRVPSEYEKLLPNATVSELKSVLNDKVLSTKEKNEKLDKIMTGLPAEVLDKIPPPPGFTELPSEIQQKLEAIARNPATTFEEKAKQHQAVIKTLPEKFRHLLPSFKGFCRRCRFLCIGCW